MTRCKIAERYLIALRNHNMAKWWLYFRAWDAANPATYNMADYSQMVDTFIQGMGNEASTVRDGHRLQSGAVPADDDAES